MKCCRLRVLVACGVVLGLVGACRREQPATAPAGPESSPTDTIEKLLALRSAGKYDDMVPLIVAERGREVAALLRAVDGFLAANQALYDHVRAHCSLELAEAIDQSDLGSHLGVFSPDVMLVAEQVSGQEATVAYSARGRLPLRHARLVRVAGAWRYDPGTGYDPKLPRAFDEMARGLRSLLADLKRQQPSAADVQENPQLLLTELSRRLAPGVRLLPDRPD